jgi:hypothetical protein
VIDVTRYLPGGRPTHWLTAKAIEAMGGVFDGSISAVAEEELRNPYTAEREPQLVLAFSDSEYKLVCNRGITKTLVDACGRTDEWVGRRVRLTACVVVTAQGRERLERRMVVYDVAAREPGEDDADDLGVVNLEDARRRRA